MKHATIQFLIFAILSSGLAWSSDSHSEAFFDHTSEAFLDVDSLDQSDDILDDHCCHATAHMAGLFSSSKEVFYIPRHSASSYSVNRFYSLIIAPPTPPPTS